MNEIGIGIVSGLITTFLVVVMRELWLKVIQPWYEERVYKDAKIEGRWRTSYGSIDSKEIVELQRTGHSISGKITVVEGADQGTVYDMRGTFNNLLLTGSYVPVNRSYLDRGSFTLMLVTNGERLEGHTSYYLDGKHTVVADRYVWDRERS